MNRKLIAIVIMAGLMLPACSNHLSIKLRQPVEAEKPHEFRAGAARVDITPLPGIPLGGFGEAAKVSRGSWMPIYARAVYFQDPDGHQLAMVICDLWSMPSGLANRVAEIVQEDDACRSIGRDQVIVAATHTHSSPAHFSTHLFYNSHASNDEGFDSELYDFLAHRIAGAIILARRNATKAELRMNRLPVQDVARNRSFDAFLHDRDCNDLLAENKALPGTAPTAPLPFAIDTDSYRAVNANLTLLRIDSAGPGHAAPIAVLAFFPVHNTAMGPFTEVYTGDVFGVATTTAEESLRRGTGSAPVVALFNSAEGDVSPNWERQDRLNTLKIGGRLAARICDGTAGAKDRLEETIAGQYDVVGLRTRRVKDSAGTLAYFADGTPEDGTIQHWTDDRATVGVATLGGGEDGWTTFHDLGYVEGVTSRRLAGRGSKETELTLGSISRPINKVLNVQATITAGGIPNEAPLGVYRIGHLVIATLPGEGTTMLGRRIAAHVKRGAGGNDSVVVVGLANEYISYFTTPEEYDVQDYEGATTLYGPASGPLLEVELERLAKQLTAPKEGTWQRTYGYEPGSVNIFTMEHVGASPWSITDGLGNIAQDPATGRPKHDFPAFVWPDAFWRIPQEENFTNVTRNVNPRVTVEVKTGGVWKTLEAVPPLAYAGAGAIAEDNTGLDFITICLGASSTASKWGAIWMYPRGLDPTLTLRFHVRSFTGATACSVPFTLGSYAGATGAPIIPMDPTSCTP